MSDKIHYQRHDTIAIIFVDNPPVNALSKQVRQALQQQITRFQTDDKAEIAILIGKGKGNSFIAGADVTEFGKPPQQPFLPDIVALIEDTPKIIIAAMAGFTLGGGLEIALAADYRLAHSDGKFGFPEVTLGVIPGAGGTQKLPRLVGIEKALELITSGKQFTATQAHQLGVVDRITDVPDLQMAAIDFTKEILQNNYPRKSVSQLPPPIAESADIFTQYQQKLQKSAFGQVAQLQAVKAIQIASEKSFAEGMKAERQLFLELLQTPQRAGLVHAFFAENRLKKIPELKQVTVPLINNVAVIGGGTMGCTIATALLLNGFAVIVIEQNDEAVQTTRKRIANLLDTSVARGKINAEKRDILLNKQLQTTSDYQQVADVDLVIEAVFEDMAVKQEIFALLDKICKKDAILATNTSYLDINEIAQATNRASQIIGLHFFSPAHIMKLLEVVIPDEATPQTIATGFAFAKKIRKIAVRSGVCDGFIGNRILAKLRDEAHMMVLAGADLYQMDKALVAFGFPMGVFAVGDLAGLDIQWAQRKRKMQMQASAPTLADFPDRICEKGWFGQKTGRGYYRYETVSKQGIPDAEMLAIIEAERQEKNIIVKTFTDQEIIDCYLAAMINEAAKIVEDGIATRPSDIDMVMIAGYGFPRYRGGPLHYADAIGLNNIVSMLHSNHQQPAKLLENLAQTGKLFDSLNEK
ncbi:MAG: FAD-dependent oxidoreductase [Alphaproteobacteria bacterium]|nr:FAD-dependent oxidoreductase [Alphaproteobacteria bacterium]